MKKRLLSILLAALMLVGMLPVTALATVALPTEATWLINEGDNHVWYKLDDTTLTIGGTGAMPNFAAVGDQPWKDAQSTITTVVIQSGVTGIGKRAFSGCTALASVTIPSGVTSIGEQAFNECAKLASVTFPTTLTTIGGMAFCKCSSLESVTIPEGVTSIKGSAFNGCTELASVTLPTSLTEVYASAFNGCSELKSITIPAKVTYIGSGAFSGCTKLTSLTVNAATPPNLDGPLFDSTPSGLKIYVPADKVDTYKNSSGELFSWGNYTNRIKPIMTKPDGATWLVENETWYQLIENTPTTDPKTYTLTIGGTGAMPDNTSNQPWNSAVSNITTIVIESGVTSIGQYAFSTHNKLESVTIPASVTSIGNNAFCTCIALKTVTIAEGSQLVSIGNSAFDTCNELESITIPASVTSIGECAFVYCEKLESITIPASVTSIGKGIFNDCRKLKTINVAEGNSNYTSVDGVLFNKEMSTLIAYPAKKEAAAYTIPEGVTEIADYAFVRSGITGITLPSTLTFIGQGVFGSCSNLTSIILKAKTPPTLCTDGAEVFAYFDSCSLYVPYGTKDSYANNNGWKTYITPEEQYITYFNKFEEAYMVSMAKTSNGSVSVSKDFFPIDTYTEEDETVTVTVTHDEGYQLKSLIYNDGENHDITEAKSFTMPRANVTVTAVFEEDTPVTHGLTVTKEGGKPVEGTEASHNDADYYREGNNLFILKDGLTVSGETAKERIVVKEEVNTLTLDGVKIIPTESDPNNDYDATGVAVYGEYGSPLKITLKNENQLGNTVTYTADEPNPTTYDDYLLKQGISARRDITFTGDGKLTIYDNESGIEAYNVIFDADFSGTLKIEDFGHEKCAIRSTSLWDESKQTDVGGNVNLLGGTFDLTSYKSYGIYAQGAVNVNNAKLTIDSCSDGIVASGDVEITSCQKVSITSKEDEPIDADGTLTIKDCPDFDVVAEDDDALRAGGDLIIDNSTVDVTADTDGLDTEAGAIIKGGSKVTVHADDEGIICTTLTVDGANTVIYAVGDCDNTDDGYGILFEDKEGKDNVLTVTGGTVKITGSTAISIESDKTLTQNLPAGIALMANTVKDTFTNLQEVTFKTVVPDTEFPDEKYKMSYIEDTIAKSVTLESTTPATHDLSVTKDGEPVVEKEGVYQWIDKQLQIQTSGLTVSGTKPTTEYIDVVPDVETLTLSGVQIVPTDENMEFAVRFNAGGTTVNLVGENVFGNAVTYNEETKASDYKLKSGIKCAYGSLTFTGAGNLTIYDQEVGIRTFDEGDVTFDKNFSGKLTIKDFGYAPECAINARGDVSLLGGTFDLTSYKSNGIYAYGNIDIKDADVTVNTYGQGIEMDSHSTGKNVTIDGSKIKVTTHGNGSGIDVPHGDVTIKNSTAEIKASEEDSGYNVNAIYAYNVNIVDSVVTATAKTKDVDGMESYGDATGILACDGLNISGDKSDVSITAECDKDSYGVYSEGAVSILDGKVRIKAGTAILSAGEDANALIIGSAANPMEIKNAKIVTAINGETWEYTGSELITEGMGGVARDIDGDYYGLLVAADTSVEDGYVVIQPKASNDCTYNKTVSLTEGTFGMKLGGKDMGWFKFEAVDGGWKIMKTSKPGMVGVILNPYLAMKDGKLAYTDSENATVWTYKNGAFSTSVKTTQKTSGHWFLFIYIPGSTKTVTTTYYLNTVTDGNKLATCFTCAELYTTVSGEHDFGCWIDCKDGEHHNRICKNCGEVETEAHDFDETTHKCVCGAYDPDEVNVKISVVDVKEKTSKQFVGFLFWGKWKDVTTYTATIKTEADGVKVTKVQYQLNGGKWMTGTCVSSDKPIETLKVKAWDNKGNVYEYEYPEAKVISTVADVLETYQGNLPTSDDDKRSLNEGGAPIYIDNDNERLFVNGKPIGLSQNVTTAEYGYSATSSGYTMKFIMTEGHLSNIILINPVV